MCSAETTARESDQSLSGKNEDDKTGWKRGKTRRTTRKNGSSEKEWKEWKEWRKLEWIASVGLLTLSRRLGRESSAVCTAFAFAFALQRALHGIALLLSTCPLQCRRTARFEPSMGSSISHLSTPKLLSNYQQTITSHARREAVANPKLRLQRTDTEQEEWLEKVLSENTETICKQIVNGIGITN